MGTDRVRPAPSARPRPVGELLVGLAVFGLYGLVQALGGAGRDAAAARNADALYALERALHLDIEAPLNSWLAARHGLAVIANYEYAYTYVLSALLLLGWLWWRRPDVYRWARTSFVWLNLLGIACFALYPLAPPRLLAGAGFVDTVLRGGTVGSWGSPLVAHANQVAAMPSLHVAWALWVSVVLALVHGGLRTQVLSGVHVALTFLVVLATANHWTLDAVGGAVAVALAVRLAGSRPAAAGRRVRVPAADTFFVHVDTPEYPQHVGGVVLLDTSERPGSAPSVEEVRARVAAALPDLPRFRQRLTPPARWRRARWEQVEELDWEYHVPLDDLHTPEGAPGGPAAFDALVARISGTQLPRDRPLWRLHVVHGVDVDRAAVVFVVHHVVSDGIGTVLQALRFLDPPRDRPLGGARRTPGALARLAATVVGLAQLATDGPARGRFPVEGTSARSFTTVVVPLDDVRRAARGRGVRITDLLLTGVAAALGRVLPEGTSLPHRMRTSVPLMVRDPDTAAEANLTAAVMVDLPLGPRAEADRLAEVSRRTARLHSGSRMLASRFVMQDIGELMPLPLHRWFARTVYGRRFFTAIVSNMPGPDWQLHMVWARIVWAGPLLPLAPGTPLAVGALSWNGDLVIGITTDPLLLPDARRFGDELVAVLGELGAQPQASASSSSNRISGSSSAAP
ncbi:bifunctional phosphatase PAP2/O-acyltransferase family protein [Petropleomorpha daqingensis]|uniref:Diacylglycerol O-acyltransferase n=1 Tax=Petropleomorpha daqingensis TaxID=2026353 RepID=A0A853CIY0_9ACTN|nr:phosphatase PAP2 family protein [Petropleomorpha daqingensis]NYJ07131.1 hypothetical protein [Petropleomorpha daqingensis]